MLTIQSLSLDVQIMLHHTNTHIYRQMEASTTEDPLEARTFYSGFQSQFQDVGE